VEPDVIGVWIGMAAVVGPIILLGVFFWLRYKGRQDTQQTIRLAIDKGQELSPELIDRLGHPKPAKNRDMRLGIIWLAVAGALAIFGFTIPDEDANTVFWGIAAFPFFIGLAYLIIWRFAGSD
jgi:Domain of unknown function (DUF6249)